MAKAKNSKIRFDKTLVLFNYFLSLFNTNDFNSFKENFKDSYLEDINEEGKSKIIKKIIIANLHGDKLTEEKLLEYDENIINHTKKINYKRSRKIKWKYFQYLTLLFTEIYLDKYFEYKDVFLEELNNYLITFLNNYNSKIKSKTNFMEISKYTLDDLRKIAFWNATGSGKTLILHINILQYKFYLKKHKKENEINNIILLTPNDGLSKQHFKELEESSIRVKRFDGKTDMFSKDAVNIISISKIQIDKTSNTKETFDITAFEKNNLLLVDEGHRGISGNVWKKMRKEMSSNGFVFEYSATFGQAIKDKDLQEEYSKSIIFDYSYKYFYKDGYGKDYKILNIKEDKDYKAIFEEKKYLYLTASLLSFYEQLKLYNSDKIYNNTFNIEKPLMLFIGHSVNKEDKENITDILDILLFLQFFIKNKDNIVTNYIKDIIKGNSGFKNKTGGDIFEKRFKYLRNSTSNELIYPEMIKHIFNSETINSELHIQYQKKDGEIVLKYGENPCFGVINIGDSSKFRKLCESKNLNIFKKDFKKNQFDTINSKDSRINILIGAKKFTEGWSSWRVSSMGLMNVGKSKGSQIIQLFGRGVRLKGVDFSLKRTSSYNDKFHKKFKLNKYQYIQILETLNIFGVKANYMTIFKEYLEDVEGLTENSIETIYLPVIFNEKYKKKLKVLQLKNIKNEKGEMEPYSFKKYGENPILIPLTLDEKFKKVINAREIKLNLYTKAEMIESDKDSTTKLTLNNKVLEDKHLKFLDYNRIFFEIENYKNEQNFYNVNIEKDSLKEIIKDSSWYKLYCKDDYLRLSVENLVKIENIVISLLKKYIKRFYKFKKSDWEKDKLEYIFIEDSDKSVKNIFDKDDHGDFKDKEYKIEIDSEDTELIKYIKELKIEIEKNKIEKISISNIEFKDISQGINFINFNKHLYNPLIYRKNTSKKVKVKPTFLNKGETTFVKLLKEFIETKPKNLESKEIYFLRNEIGAVGFFEESNFYPDFILWIIDTKNKKEYITFIDPKGILIGDNDSKINLHKTIKNYEKDLGNENVILNSFILSNTSAGKLISKGYTKEEYEDKNVLFIDENLTYKNKIKSIKIMIENILK